MLIQKDLNDLLIRLKRNSKKIMTWALLEKISDYTLARLLPEYFVTWQTWLDHTTALYIYLRTAFAVVD